jgi:hypothetical protein
MSLTKPLITRRLGVAVLVAAALVGAGGTAASDARAADPTSSSMFVHPDAPWLCKGGMAGWKWFQYSNCTGKSYPATRP